MIEGIIVETYDIASAKFLIKNSLGKVRFFKETLLLADTNMEMILEILFFLTI